MTNSAAPGGASASWRGGDAHYGSAADLVARGILLRTVLHIRRRNSGTQAGMDTGQSEHNMTVNDGGMMQTSACCHGLWNRAPARALRQRIIRRNPMDVALYRRVSTRRQPQHQTLEPPLSRLHASVALQPDWPVAAEHISRDDGYRGATLKRPGLDRLRDRAAMAALECVLVTAPDRFARNDVQQRLLVDERTQRGCRVACVERPMSADPPAHLL